MKDAFPTVHLLYEEGAIHLRHLPHLLVIKKQVEVGANSPSIIHIGFSTNLFGDEMDCDVFGKFSFFYITQSVELHATWHQHL